MNSIENEQELIEFIQKNYGTEVCKPGLDRAYDIFKPLVNEIQNKFQKIVIIGGTNGKGQTIHTLASYINYYNDNYFMWTSPHIISICERFHSNDKNINFLELVNLVLISHQEILNAKGNLTFYEFLFYVFLKFTNESYNSQKINYLLLEVGLGGKYDSVNYFDADVACITSISRDHQLILGNTYKEILCQKLGIARSGKILISNLKLNYLNEYVFNFCFQNEIIWKNIYQKSLEKIDYFDENIQTAKKVFEEISFGKIVPLSLKLNKFKGRKEVLYCNSNTFVFNGAHNVDGMRRMLDNYCKDSESFEIWPNTVLVSFSQRTVGEIKIMLKMLDRVFNNKSKLLLTNFNHEKAFSSNELIKILKDSNLSNIKFTEDWKNEINKKSSEIYLCCGSYYFIGEIQKFITI